MIAQVTEQGVLIPKELLGSAKQVQIWEEPGRLVVVLHPADDPIWDLGKYPVRIDVDDASVNHDKYIYDGK